MPGDVIGALLSRLRSDDVYFQILHYPTPEHRSTALAQQARFHVSCMMQTPGPGPESTLSCVKALLQCPHIVGMHVLLGTFGRHNVPTCDMTNTTDVNVDKRIVAGPSLCRVKLFLALEASLDGSK